MAGPTHIHSNPFNVQEELATNSRGRKLDFVLASADNLSAISTNVHGASPVILVPQTYWNADQLSLK